jgi:hypothetical protein
MAPDDKRCRHAGGTALYVHVDRREILGVVSELDAPSDQRWVHPIGVAL